MSEKESIHRTLDNILKMMEEAIGNLSICHYINHPSRFKGVANHQSDIDYMIMFRILNYSTHFRRYQWFTWKLFIIELSKILGGSTDKFSVEKLKNKMQNKLFLEENNFGSNIEAIEVFFKENNDLIAKVKQLRSSHFAHSDFNSGRPEINFNECWDLLNKLKIILSDIASHFYTGYLFSEPVMHLNNMTEFEAYYNQITNPKTALDRNFLKAIVGEEYVKKINMIK